jgi:hypothetical protein
VTNDPVVAIASVTGAVGAEFIATLNKRRFPLGKLKALASARSAGKKLGFRGEVITVEELTEHSFDGVDLALFSAGSGIARKYAPIAVKAGAVVIDNSSAFRMDPNVPLVISGDQRPPHHRPQGHHRRAELLGDHRAGAAVADPPQQPHQARDPVDLSGGERRRRGCHGGARGIDARTPCRPCLSTESPAASLCVQRLQSRHQDRSRDRLQRGGDQGDPGEPKDS